MSLDNDVLPDCLLRALPLKPVATELSLVDTTRITVELHVQSKLLQSAYVDDWTFYTRDCNLASYFDTVDNFLHQSICIMKNELRRLQRAHLDQRKCQRIFF